MGNPLLRPRAWLGLSIALAMLLAWPRALQAGGVVGNGTPGSCTEAAFSARLAGGGAISFNCGPAPATISITSIKQISANTSVDGGGLITLSGGGTTGLFSVTTGASLRLSSLMVRDGSAIGGGGVFNEGVLVVNQVAFLNNNASVGGAIYNINDGMVTVDNSTFAGNSGQFGGAIRNLGGTVVVRSSTFSQNSAINDGDGGAILNRLGSLNVTDSVFSDNQAGNLSGGGVENNDSASIGSSVFTGNTAETNGGGAVYNGLNGRLTITGSTFVDNQAGDQGGGGVLTENGTLLVINSTFSANTAGLQGGGGLYSEVGTTEIVNSTFSANTAGVGGAGSVSGTLTLSSTIVADGLAGSLPSNCGGPITSLGHNLDSGATCGFAAVGDLSSTAALLGPLRSAGGATPTHALLVGSPAINHGGASCPATDQRGVPRPQGTACDIGAYEYGGILYIPLVRKE
jgi:hypothetical protein